MRVQDWKQQELVVGTRVVYGSPETPEESLNQIGTITEISEPDIHYRDDEWGREIAVGQFVVITVKFPDDSVEKVNAQLQNRADWDDEAEVYEEGGDLEVAAGAEHTTHTYAVSPDSKMRCVYCGAEMEL